jgi:hypothetical protein
MEAHPRLLKLAARGQLPERIDDQSTPEFDSYRGLIEAGCLKTLDASSHPPAGGRAYLVQLIVKRCLKSCDLSRGVSHNLRD